MLRVIYNYKYLTPTDLAGFDKYQVLLTIFNYSMLSLETFSYSFANNIFSGRTLASQLVATQVDSQLATVASQLA